MCVWHGTGAGGKMVQLILVFQYHLKHFSLLYTDIFLHSLIREVGPKAENIGLQSSVGSESELV